MSSDKDNEKVLVVKTDLLFPNGVWEGFREVDFQKTKDIIATHGKYLERKFAETDSSWQQIITQVILLSNKKIFYTRIPQTGSEGRLHDMWHIFLGGHINDFDEGIDEAVEREFNEEINYKGKIVNKTFFGIVKLKTPEVNSVHTGLVFIYEGDSEAFEPTGDNGLIDGKFVELTELVKYSDRMTYWTKIVVPHLMKVVK